MDFNENYPFKRMAQVASICVVICFILIFTKALPGKESLLGLALFIFFAIIFVPMIVLTLRVAVARRKAFKTRDQISWEYAKNTSEGKLFLNIHNIGDGSIRIKSVGFLDRYWQYHGHGKNRTRKAVDVLRYARHKNLPLTLHHGMEESMELEVIPNVFEHTFAGVFYEIDLTESELHNKHAKFLANMSFTQDGSQPGCIKKSILDKRLHLQFCGKQKIKKTQTRFAWIIMGISLLLWLLFVVFIFFGRNI